MTEDRDWPGEWLRGVLPQAVLRVLDDGPTYGYALAARLAEAGIGEIKGGTLYPLLGRLEAAGHLTVEWRAGEGGPGRKYYEITPEGRRHLHDLVGRWRSFAAVVEAHLAAPPPAGEDPRA